MVLVVMIRDLAFYGRTSANRLATIRTVTGNWRNPVFQRTVLLKSVGHRMRLVCNTLTHHHGKAEKLVMIVLDRLTDGASHVNKVASPVHTFESLENIL